MGKFSIITPCKNSEKYLSETIESVIFQKGDFDIEYIFIDCCSNDNTLNIINFYKEKIETDTFFLRCNSIEFKIICENDNGIYDALTKGFSLCTGDIIAYINSDDYYMPHTFRTVQLVFEKYNNIKWLTGVECLMNEYGQLTKSILPYKYDSKLIIKGFYGTWLRNIQQESVFWKRELLGLLNYEELKSFKLAGDYYIWKKFAEKNDLYIVRARLAGFRRHEKQLSKNYSEYLKEFNQIRNKRKSIIQYLKAILYRIIWDMPDKLKLFRNKKIIGI